MLLGGADDSAGRAIIPSVPEAAGVHAQAVRRMGNRARPTSLTGYSCSGVSVGWGGAQVQVECEAGPRPAFGVGAVLIEGTAAINCVGILILALSPHLALVAQFGLSRVREFDADLEAARISGDPVGLARALAKIEQVNRSWRNWLLPGWGNPDPSWLRTHPATEERIRRLQHVQSVSFGAEEWATSRRWQSGDMRAQPVRSGPRWRLGGYWW